MLPTTTFEMLVSATINRMIAEQKSPFSMFDRLGEVMDKVVNRSYDIYRDLVFGNEYFYDYFLNQVRSKQFQALILVHVQLLVRPLQKLVVYVRFLGLLLVTKSSDVPGWYGVGSSFKEFIDEDPENIETLRYMYKNWPFFQSLLSNVDMVLSKANMDIAFEYAQLCEEEEVRNIYQIILHEWQLTKDIILMIEEQDELLAENPYLKESLDYRMPYFNVLNYIQLELIRRQRTGQLPADQDKLIHITINGVATGLRNSG